MNTPTFEKTPATRHPDNTNLTLHHESIWNGMSVNVSSGPLIRDYLEGIDDTLWAATEDHLRTLAIRVDLHFPCDQCYDTQGVMSRFIDSFKAQIQADLQRRQKQGKRVHRCSVRYVWARERDRSINFHYHVVILLNYDAYRSLGRFDADSGNTAARIRRAWARALRLPLYETEGLVHFADNTGILLDVNSGDFSYQYDELIYRYSYLAKAYSKEFGDGERNFGCSRSPGRANPASCHGKVLPFASERYHAGG